MHTLRTEFSNLDIEQGPEVKRKLVISFLVLAVGVVFTIAVRADLYSRGNSTSQKTQAITANLPLVASFLDDYLNTREEGSYLVLEGGVFLALGLLWLKRARREKMLVGAQPDSKGE